MRAIRRFALPAAAALVLAAPAALAQGSGPGPGWGMMGPGGPAPWMGSQMMGPGYGPGTGWGPGMMGQGPGMMGYAPGPQFGPPGDRNLAADDVRAMLEWHLSAAGNPRLKLGEVQERDADTVVADIVTAQDGALVDRVAVDRHTGAIQRVQ